MKKFIKSLTFSNMFDLLVDLFFMAICLRAAVWNVSTAITWSSWSNPISDTEGCGVLLIMLFLFGMACLFAKGIWEGFTSLRGDVEDILEERE